MPRTSDGRWIDKRGRMVCGCGGYWFPHRRGSGACDHSPTIEYHLSLRHGEPLPVAMEYLSAADLRRIFPMEDDK